MVGEDPRLIQGRGGRSRRLTEEGMSITAIRHVTNYKRERERERIILSIIHTKLMKFLPNNLSDTNHLPKSH